jgi:hypothetical protein
MTPIFLIACVLEHTVLVTRVRNNASKTLLLIVSGNVQVLFATRIGGEIDRVFVLLNTIDAYTGAY